MHMTLNSIPTGVLIAVLITAAVIDMKRHRLPNSLTASAALVGHNHAMLATRGKRILKRLSRFFYRTAVVFTLLRHALDGRRRRQADGGGGNLSRLAG